MTARLSLNAHRDEILTQIQEYQDTGWVLNGDLIMGDPMCSAQMVKAKALRPPDIRVLRSRIDNIDISNSIAKHSASEIKTSLYILLNRLEADATSLVDEVEIFERILKKWSRPLCSKK